MERHRRTNISPVVVTLHLVVKDLALFRCGVGDQLRLDDLEDVIADVRQFRLDLRLVVSDQRQLVALCTPQDGTHSGGGKVKINSAATLPGMCTKYYHNFIRNENIGKERKAEVCRLWHSSQYVNFQVSSVEFSGCATCVFQTCVRKRV